MDACIEPPLTIHCIGITLQAFVAVQIFPDLELVMNSQLFSMMERCS